MIDVNDSLDSFSKSIEDRLRFTVDFLQKLKEANALYFLVNKNVVNRIEKFKNQDTAYLIHEYLNRNWQPIRFTEMANHLEPAKLAFATSAHLLDLVEALNLTKPQADLLREIKRLALKESIKDLMTYQTFRRDIWARGYQPLTSAERISLLHETKFILIANRNDFNFKVSGSNGEIELNQELYGVILDKLANHEPISLRDLRSALVPVNMNMSQMLQAITLLVGMGEVAIVSRSANDKDVIERSQSLNKMVMARNLVEYNLEFLSSAVTGGGIRIDRMHQVLLLNIKSASESAEHVSKYISEYLSLRGQKLVVDGEAVLDSTREHNEIFKIASDFLEKYLKIYISLKIISLKNRY